MCGICGIVFDNPNISIDPNIILAMRDIMNHRGPDEFGSYSDESAHLGHRRLSIIDLTGGKQPMCNEDGSLWITYNGEVYNHHEHRSTLTNKGHVIKTHSDTEILLHLYEEMGEEMLHCLNGMFAFAIWDKRNKRLFVARDRLGIKPIYYARIKGAFLFASEIKALLASGMIQIQPNFDIIREYLVFRYVAGPQTFFKNIYQLMPGQTLTLEKGREIIRTYWKPFSPLIDKDMPIINIEKTLRELIIDSVQKRLMSDVPLGTFCSGGVDSSLISALAQREKKNSPLHTFSIGFSDNSYDESKYAQIVSGHIGSNHHLLMTGEKEFVDNLEKAIYLHDEPLNHPNSVHIYLISKIAKEFVTVVLTGEGADELFGGYPRYLMFKASDVIRKIPIINRIVPVMFESLDGIKLKRFAESIKYNDVDRAINNSYFTHRDLVSTLIGNQNGIGSFRESTYNDALNNGATRDQALLLLDQQTYLTSILIRQDKLSMGASVESRVPFLDYRIVEFANSLPFDYKIKNINLKYLIKNISLLYLPKNIIYRKKIGFGVPLDSWFRNKYGLGNILRKLIEMDNDSNRLYDMNILKKLINEHEKCQKDHSEILWTILNLGLWWKMYVKSVS